MLVTADTIVAHAIGQWIRRGICTRGAVRKIGASRAKGVDAIAGRRSTAGFGRVGGAADSAGGHDGAVAVLTQRRTICGHVDG